MRTFLKFLAAALLSAGIAFGQAAAGVGASGVSAGGVNGGGSGGGVTSIIAGTGISVDQATGAVTITNTGSGGDMVLASVQTVTGAKTFGTIGGAVGKLILAGSTSGSSILNAAAVAGSTTITLPNANSTLPIFSQQITFAGPTAPRTVTLLDLDYTTARQDAAQTFTGVQSFTSPAVTTSLTTPSTTFALVNTTATTVNFAGGASTALNIGNASGATTMLGILGVDGATPSSSTALIVPAGTTSLSSLRIPHGAAPTSPVNGDMWTTTSGVFLRINGSTIGPLAAGGSGTVSSGTTNTVAKYTASTTVGNSLLTDDATTLTYSGTGGIVTSGAASGLLTLNGVTSGKTIYTTADATAQTLTVSTAAQTSGAATATIPDLAGASQTFSFIGKAETLSGAKTFSGGVLASGANANDFSGGSGTFKTSTGANTIAGAATFNSTISLGGTALSFGALPSGATTAGALATYAANTYTVTGTNTATAFQGTYHGVVTVTDASAGTVTDLFDTVWAGPAAAAGSLTATRAHTLGIKDSTSAASSITGGLVVAATFGTTATSVGIGGGNVNAGGNGTFGGTLAVTGHVTLEGVTSTGATGTNLLVFATTPTITTPVFAGGNTASGSGANTWVGSTGTFITSTGANTLSGAVTVNDATTPSITLASGKTNTGFLQINGKTSGAWKLIAADAAAQTVTTTLLAQTTGAGTINIPDLAGGTYTQAFNELTPNSQSTAYQFVLADAYSKFVLHPVADNNARTFTIPANGSVAFPLGAVITVVNQINTLTIAITTDTLTWYAGAGTGSTGSRTVAAGSTITLMKVTATTWIIMGNGITMLNQPASLQLADNLEMAA